VLAVVTAKDLAEVPDILAEIGEDAVLSLKYLSNNILAGDKVLYKGHPVAAVAAENAHEAEAALKLIKVDYEVLPTVVTVEDAMKPDAAILHEQSPDTSNSSWVTWMKVSSKPTLWWKESSAPRRCTRGTSSLRAPQRCGTTMAG